MRRDGVVSLPPLCGISIIAVSHDFVWFDTQKRRQYPTEGLNFRDMFRQHWGLLSWMEAIELGDIVHLYIVPDAISKSVEELSLREEAMSDDFLTCGGRLVYIHCTRPGKGDLHCGI